MRRPARATSAGLLLVEAVISAVVIAVGLVFVSRALSGQLRALKRLEESAVLLALAEGKLREIEAACPLQPSAAPDPQRAGTFDEPSTNYQWELTVEPASDQGGAEEMPLSTVTIAVQRREPASGAVRLSMAWPTEWADRWR